MTFVAAHFGHCWRTDQSRGLDVVLQKRRPRTMPHCRYMVANRDRRFILITPLPGAHQRNPGSATLPFFGVDPAVVDEKGHEVGPNIGGKLIIRRPWPSMLRTIYGDKARYRQQYWSEFKGNYLTGDGARRDKDGYFWIVGRIDDVLNVAGHRLGTSEIESALVSHPGVAEAAVVGRPDELKGRELSRL